MLHIYQYRLLLTLIMSVRAHADDGHFLNWIHGPCVQFKKWPGSRPINMMELKGDKARGDYGWAGEPMSQVKLERVQ